MYAEIVTIPGITTATNLKTALVQVLTGETSVNNLTAIDTTASEIRSSISPAGWTQHDGEDVLKAPLNYTIDYQKYVWLDITDTQFYFRAYENWDEITHTGTNGTVNSETNLRLRWSLTQQTRFYISASERHILINTNYGTTWGDSNGSGALGLFEFENRAINHGTNYVPYFGVLVCSLMQDIPGNNMIIYIMYHMSFYLCRSVKYDLSEVVGDKVLCSSPTALNATMYVSNLHPNDWTKQIIMPDLSRILVRIPLTLHKASNYIMNIGRFCELCDVWFLPRSTENGSTNRGQILSYDGAEYIAFYSGDSYYWSVPNG